MRIGGIGSCSPFGRFGPQSGRSRGSIPYSLSLRTTSCSRFATLVRFTNSPLSRKGAGHRHNGFIGCLKKQKNLLKLTLSGAKCLTKSEFVGLRTAGRNIGVASVIVRGFVFTARTPLLRAFPLPHSLSTYLLATVRHSKFLLFQVLLPVHREVITLPCDSQPYAIVSLPDVRLQKKRKTHVKWG